MSQFIATLHNVPVLSFPCPHNKQSNVQLQFLSLCRLQQLAMPSRLTVVLVSLLLATPAVILWIWLLILPERVAIQCPEECCYEKVGYHVDCSSSSLNSIPLNFPANFQKLALDSKIIRSLKKDIFIWRGLSELEEISVIN
jgi:hypothetical protein